MLLLTIAVGFAILALRNEGNAPVQSVGPLVGAWKRTDSAAKKTHTLTLSPSGRMRITTYESATGTLLQNVTGTWQAENGRLFWYEDGRGVSRRVARHVSHILGVHDEESLSIISVTEQELQLGDPSGPLVYLKQ
jgi:hypothetical protein